MPGVRSSRVHPSSGLEFGLHLGDAPYRLEHSIAKSGKLDYNGQNNHGDVSMTEIVKSKDCGNSPKNLLVQELAVSIERADRAAFSRCISENIAWAYQGRSPVVGRASASELLESMRSQAPLMIEVEHAISHGRVGAANGTVQLASGTRIGFCHVIEFASVKGDRVARITSYYANDVSGSEELKHGSPPD